MDKTQKPKGWGTRYTLVIMCFILLTLHTALRVNISVAIVAMVSQGILTFTKYFKINNKTLILDGGSNNDTLGYECPFPEENQDEMDSMVMFVISTVY